jgi:acetyl-CoA synthetase
MELIYEKFTNVTFDENGRLNSIDFDVPDNYNFGFDVMDALAEKNTG